MFGHHQPWSTGPAVRGLRGRDSIGCSVSGPSSRGRPGLPPIEGSIEAATGGSAARLGSAWCCWWTLCLLRSTSHAALPHQARGEGAGLDSHVRTWAQQERGRPCRSPRAQRHAGAPPCRESGDRSVGASAGAARRGCGVTTKAPGTIAVDIARVEPEDWAGHPRECAPDREIELTELAGAVYVPAQDTKDRGVCEPPIGIAAWVRWLGARLQCHVSAIS